MTFHTAAEFAQRQKQMQRAQATRWMQALAKQAGIVSAQSADLEFLEKLLLPAQASVQWILDEPCGDQLLLNVYPNGSLVLQNDFEFLDELDEREVGEILTLLSEQISDLFHNDALRHSHALIRAHSGGFLLRSIAQVGSVESLCGFVSEALVLKETLLEHLQLLLSGSGHDH